MSTPPSAFPVAQPSSVPPTGVRVARYYTGHALAGAILGGAIAAPLLRDVATVGALEPWAACTAGAGGVAAWSAWLRRQGLGTLAASRALLPLMGGGIPALAGGLALGEPAGPLAAFVAGGVTLGAWVSAYTAWWARRHRAASGEPAA